MKHIRIHYGNCNLNCKYCFISKKNRTITKIEKKWVTQVEKIIKNFSWVTWYVNNLDFEFISLLNSCNKTNTIFWRGTSTIPIEALKTLRKSHFIISYDKDDINGTNKITKKALSFLQNYTYHRVSIISLIVAKNIEGLQKWTKDTRDEFKCNIKFAKLYVSKYHKDYYKLSKDIVEIPNIKNCYIFDMEEDHVPWIIKNKYYYQGKTFNRNYTTIY